MEFDENTGDLKVISSITISKYMTRTGLIKTSDDWEIWMTRDNKASAYRLIIKPEKFNDEIILIIFMKKNDGPISRWNFSPSNGMDGPQTKPEGKYTKLMRVWFANNFSKKIANKCLVGRSRRCVRLSQPNHIDRMSISALRRKLLIISGSY